MARLINADALNIRKYTRWFEDPADERQVERMIREAPTIEAAPVVHGKWVTTRTIIHDGELYCSLCGQEALAEYGRHTYIKSNYCPNCGAKMDKEK